MKVIFLMMVCLFGTGCATMIRGTEQQVSVYTNPPGAKIEFSNGQSCQSPCTIVCKRKQSLQVTISKEGCQTQTVTMIPTLAIPMFGGVGTALLRGIDFATGAAYDLYPNPLTVTLTCEKK